MVKDTKKKQRLNIKVAAGIEETLELYCKESKDSLATIFRMQGMLSGVSERQTNDKKVMSVADQKDEFLNSIMSICFFAGIFIAKKHPKMIKKFSYEDIEDVEEIQKRNKPNYMG